MIDEEIGKSTKHFGGLTNLSFVILKSKIFKSICTKIKKLHNLFSRMIVLVVIVQQRNLKQWKHVSNEGSPLISKFTV